MLGSVTFGGGGGGGAGDGGGSGGGTHSQYGSRHHQVLPGFFQSIRVHDGADALAGVFAWSVPLRPDQATVRQSEATTPGLPSALNDNGALCTTEIGVGSILPEGWPCQVPVSVQGHAVRIAEATVARVVTATPTMDAAIFAPSTLSRGQVRLRI